MRKLRSLFLLLFTSIVFGLLFLCFPHSVSAEAARDLTSRCTFSYTKGSTKNTDVLFDGRYEKFWEAKKSKNNYLEVHLPAGEVCSGVQIKWAEVNRKWCVEVEQNGEWVAVDGYKDDLLTTWTPLDGVTAFRIASHSNYPHFLRIRELIVLSAGDRPESIQIWEPTVEKADLMLVIAHPDDEFIFFGGLIPYYGAERGKNVLVVYITECGSRRTELLDGLWLAGQRTYPLTGIFHDRYTMRLDEAYRRIGKKKVQNYLIRLFRQYRPEVVVTHDIHGEYGHGMHKLCADVVLNALEKSADERADKSSYQTYGPWEVKKCYLHLYPENQVVFDWNSLKLSAFGGKSAFDVANDAWHCHLSQQKSKYRVYVNEEYDSQVFGLYASTVGPDLLHNDFFENIPDATPSNPSVTGS